MPFLTPPIAAIGGFFATTVAAGGFGVFALKLAGSLILSAASRAFMPKPDMVTQARTVTIREPVSPRHLVYGFTRKGGTIIYINSRAGLADGDTLDLVIVVAGHRVSKIGSIYFNGELAIPDGGSAGTGQWEGVASVERHLGRAGAMPFQQLSQVSPGLWSVNHRLEGCAAIRLTLTASADKFPTGIPNITCDVTGKDDIYDPRSDTFKYTENAALCVADYMSLDPYGIGAVIGADIDTDSLIEAANVCGETVERVGGGTERRYNCNGVVTLDQTPQAIIEAMLTSMAGRCVWRGGSWHIQAGAYRIPTVTLAENDIRERGLTLATRVSRSANFNGVRGQFISPENDWQPDDFPPVKSAAYKAEDNNERVWRDISLPFTISASAAQRLAKIELERARRQMTVKVSGKMTAWQAAVGETVSLNYTRWGFAAKPFDVVNLTLDFGDQVLPELTLQETSPLIYDWSASEAEVYAAAPRTTLPNAFNPLPPGTPQIVEELYQTRNGVGVKALVRLSWQASPTPFVRQYQVDSRLAGGIWQTQGVTDNLTLEILDIAPGDWEFRVKGITNLGVSSDWAETSLAISGLSATPVALSGVTLQSAGGLAVLKWDIHPDLDVRIGGFIVIRHSANAAPAWANSVSMDRIGGNQAIAVVPLKPGAYVLRAEDGSGNLGPETVISTTGIQALAFAPITNLQEDTTFTGTKTDCFVTAGTLQLSSSSQIDSWASVNAIVNIDNEGGLLPLATYLFATGMNFGSVRLARLRSVIDLSTVNLFDQIDTRTGNIDTWTSFDGPEGGEVDCVVEYRTTQTNPSGSPVWGAWGRVDNTEIQAWGVQARAILSSQDASFTPAVSQLRLFADEVA